MPSVPWLACCRAATEADDVTVRVLDIEVLRAPRRGRKGLDDGYAVGDTLLIERFDPIDTRRGVEMLVLAPPTALSLVTGRFLQVNFQSVQVTNGVETIPRLAEAEADLLVIRDRAIKVVDEELRSERRHARLHVNLGCGYGTRTNRIVLPPCS